MAANYAWNRQLEQVVQAIDDSNVQLACQQFTTRFFQGACISKAMWSSSRDSDQMLKPCNVNPQCHVQLSETTSAYPLSPNSPDVKTMELPISQPLPGPQLKAIPQTQQPQGKQSTVHGVSMDGSLGIFTTNLLFLDPDMGGSNFKAKFTNSSSAEVRIQYK